MATRPEGLSPCYYSLASPDIPESRVFKWTWPGQTSATIRLYSESNALLKTYAVSGSTNEVSLSNIGYSFVLGTAYYWTVQAQNSQVSAKAYFKYDACPASPSIVWNHIPKEGDVIVSGTYFKEIKDNLIEIFNDYQGAPAWMYRNINSLFTNEVVPSREDFKTLEDAIDYLSTYLEDSVSVDVDGPVEDSLGVSDLEILRRHLEKITNVRPKPVQNMSIDAESPGMYRMNSIHATSDGRLDASIDVSWTVGSMNEYRGSFVFTKLSPSKDVRYYRVEFQYGPSNNSFTSTLFYKEEWLDDGKRYYFDTDWDGLYNASNAHLARIALTVTTVDHRNNESIPLIIAKSFGANFKTPLGVQSYEVEVQRLAMTATTYAPSGTWYEAYKGTATNATRVITGGEGKMFFRARAIDKSGMMTDWIYSNGVLFDPLTAPGAVPGFRSTNITANSISLAWNTTARATEYQVMRDRIDGLQIYRGANLSAVSGNLYAAANNTYFVRAGNRVGWGPWTSITVKTLSSRKTSYGNSTNSRSWSNKYGWKTNTNKVYQGEWCNNWSTDHYVVGAGNTCWGKHKGLWLFNDSFWRAELAGRKIIKVELYMERQLDHNGDWGSQKPTFWTHNYGSFPSGEPALSNKYGSPLAYAMGEKKWVTLPNSYGEALRDGRAKGIGIYLDNWAQRPYIIFESWVQLKITHE